MDAADGGEALEVREREHHRPLDHAVDQQRVGLRIDLGNTAVMPLEVQVGRRDRAVEILMGRARGIAAARLALRLFGGRPLAERPTWFAADFGRIRGGLCHRGLAERHHASGACEEIASRHLHRGSLLRHRCCADSARR